MREISAVLKDLARVRKESDIPIEKIQEILEKEYGIKAAVKTIYGWESGKVQPQIKTFIALCKIYKIHDIYDLFDNDIDKVVERTIKEEKMIKNYYKRPQYQEAIDKLLAL